MWGSRIGRGPAATTGARQLPTVLVVLAGIIALLAALAAGVSPAADATEPAPNGHGGNLVPEMPNWQTDQVANGRVLGGDRVGDLIVVGGNFTQVRLADGTMVDQPYLAAFRVSDGTFVDTFRPELDKVVLAVEAGNLPGTVLIGGKFREINGDVKPRLALLRTADGTTEPNFKGRVNGTVKAMELEGEHLYIGGKFKKVNFQPQENLARVSSVTGKIDPSWTIEVTGSRASGRRADGLRWTANGPVVRDVSITPDGSRLSVVHRGDEVGGLERWGAAMIDLGPNPSVSGWDASDLWPASDFVGNVEASMSPDGSMIAISTFIGNFPPIHDTVIAFPVAGNGDVDPLWVTQMFDSTYGLAISEAAVYVGGHFCWVEAPHHEPDPIDWPGSSGNQYSCSKGGAGHFPNVVHRDQMAALDLATGHALEWDPGSNAWNGVRWMRVVDRGLLVGHDGGRINGRKVGRYGFLDLGPAYDTTVVPDFCTVSESNGTVTIEWMENAAKYWGLFVDGQWFRKVDDYDGGTQLHDPGPGTHDYVVRSVFPGGLKEDTDCGSVTVG